MTAARHTGSPVEDCRLSDAADDRAPDRQDERLTGAELLAGSEPLSRRLTVAPIMHIMSTCLEEPPPLSATRPATATAADSSPTTTHRRP